MRRVIALFLLTGCGDVALGPLAPDEVTGTWEMQMSGGKSCRGTIADLRPLVECSEAHCNLYSQWSCGDWNGQMSAIASLDETRSVGTSLGGYGGPVLSADLTVGRNTMSGTLLRYEPHPAIDIVATRSR